MFRKILFKKMETLYFILTYVKKKNFRGNVEACPQKVVWFFTPFLSWSRVRRGSWSGPEGVATTTQSGDSDNRVPGSVNRLYTKHTN